MSDTPANMNHYVDRFFSHNRWERLYRSDFIRTLALYMSAKNYEHDDEIVVQGEHPQKVIFVVEGHIVVRKRTSDHIYTNVAITPPGRTLCEQSFFDRETASAFCHARGDVIVLEMSRKQYEKLSEDHPVIALILNEYLASIISQRLRNLLGKLSEMSEYFGIR